MARKKKTPQPIQMPQRSTASIPAEEPERIEKRGHLDQPLLMLTMLLLGMGLLCLFSASYATAYDDFNGNSTHFIFRQGIFAAGGVVVMLVASKFDYHKLHYFAIPALLLAVGVMATVKIPGVKNLWVTINGATRWMELPGIGTFQPSELAKIAVILCFSSLATIYGSKKMHTLRYGILPFMAILGIFALEMIWEKHLSGTMIIAAIGMIIIYFGGANLFWFGLGGCGVGAAALWYLSTERGKYAMERIDIWLDPFSDPLGAGWQGVQAQANDFIFAVWCEEMGFIGAVILVVLFALLIWRGYYIALNASDKFGTLLAAGITTQIAVQTFLNLCVVTGLLPITGASLPFFSYGGTALLIQLAEMGILLAISRHMPAPKEG